MSTTIQSRANQAVELDNKIQLQETLWSGGLIPTGMLIEEIEQLIGILESLEEKTPNKKPVSKYIRKMKRKLSKYQESMKVEWIE